jgi:aspartyl-tRNA(Asn)/glutamyl-tRNA(Gln) amidotransferase subunit A
VQDTICESMAQITDEPQPLLGVLVAARRARRVLTVGPGTAGDALWMLRAMPAAGFVLSIEPDREAAELARGRIHEAGLDDHAVVMIGEPERLAAKVGGPFDLILVDLERSRVDVLRDRLAALLEPGGTLVVRGATPLASIAETHAALVARRTTSTALVDSCLERITSLNSRLNAFITITAERARDAAARADAEFDRGEIRGPLHGIPVSLKDLIDEAGVVTTAGSRALADNVAAADAALVARLRAAGAVLVGKCNMHEFALGTTNEDSGFGAAHHPRDFERAPGGSSGGSAISVATGMSLASIGSDTGGSIRIPAAACGIVGLKPGFGEVPTDGVVPLSPSLDHMGPLAATVADAWIVYTALSGRSGSDAALPDPVDPRALRLGALGGYFTTPLEDDVRAIVAGASEALRRAGASLSDLTVRSADRVAPTYAAIVLSEAALWHAPLLERRAALYTPRVRERLDAGREVSALHYLRAQQERDVLRHEVDEALAEVDALILPTLPIVAPRLGQQTVRLGDRDEPVRALMLRLTQPFNLTGHPALSLPCGETSGGLPVGLQVVAKTTRELISVARTIERLVSHDGGR